jgi:hypothetical protein
MVYTLFQEGNILLEMHVLLTIWPSTKQGKEIHKYVHTCHNYKQQTFKSTDTFIHQMHFICISSKTLF